VVPKSLYLREDFGQPTRAHSFPGNTLVEPLDQGKHRRRLLIGNFASLGIPRVGKPQCRTQPYDHDEEGLGSVLSSGRWKIHLTQRRPEKHAEGDRQVDHRHRQDRHGDA
jgi:hypothetical protein